MIHAGFSHSTDEAFGLRAAPGRVIVEVMSDVEDTSPGGIFLPGTKAPIRRATVVSVAWWTEVEGGDEETKDNGRWHLDAGSVVLFPSDAGIPIVQNGKQLLILDEAAVLAEVLSTDDADGAVA